jgi:hypothetical protein
LLIKINKDGYQLTNNKITYKYHYLIMKLFPNECVYRNDNDFFEIYVY